jgi:tetratricopeptide (TPR) repeat protein
MTDSTRHSQILATYIQVVGECPIIAAQPIPPASKETVETLQKALTNARNERNWPEAAQIANALTMIYFDRFDLFTARQQAAESVELLRVAGSTPIHVARALGNLATIHYYTGETDTAVNFTNEAIQVAVGAGLTLWQGYFWCSMGSILCYTGKYSAATECFDQARTIFIQEESELGVAWMHYRQASEQDRDQGDNNRMVKRLQGVLALLREKTSPKIAIEILLALGEGTLLLGDAAEANEHLLEAEHLVNVGKYYWYRPSLYMLQARLVLHENDPRLAAQIVYKALGIVGDQGDPRVLSPMYRLLATVLQYARSDQDSVTNALERAMAAGRSRARYLDLALALKEAGTYIKATAMRPTARARGSGFLFEAEKMLGEMGLPTT